MPELKSNKQNQIAMYDFATQGGAIGVHRTGMIIPSWNLIPSLTFVETLPFTSAASLAKISIGWISLDQNPVAVFPVEFFAATVITALPAPAPTPWMGLHGEANPFRINLPVEIIFSITVEDLTAGRLMMFADYFNSDI